MELYVDTAVIAEIEEPATMPFPVRRQLVRHPAGRGRQEVPAR